MEGAGGQTQSGRQRARRDTVAVYNLQRLYPTAVLYCTVCVQSL